MHPDPDSAGEPVAVVLPGSGYTLQAPLLYWCVRMLQETGWRVVAEPWANGTASAPDPRRAVEEHVASLAGAARGDVRLIVGKSLGTLAMPWAVRNGVPGVWITPVLTDAAVALALNDADPRHLAVGGDADPFWSLAEGVHTRARRLTVAGADHRLTEPSGWRRSIELQTAVLSAVEEHVRTLRSDA